MRIKLGEIPACAVQRMNRLPIIVFFLGFFHGYGPDVVILRISGECNGGRGLREKPYHQHGVWHVIKKQNTNVNPALAQFRIVMRLLRFSSLARKKITISFFLDTASYPLFVARRQVIHLR